MIEIKIVVISVVMGITECKGIYGKFLDKRMGHMRSVPFNVCIFYLK